MNPSSLIAQFAAPTNAVPNDLFRLFTLEIDFLKRKLCGLLKLLYLIHESVYIISRLRFTTISYQLLSSDVTLVSRTRMAACPMELAALM